VRDPTICCMTAFSPGLNRTSVAQAMSRLRSVIAFSLRRLGKRHVCHFFRLFVVYDTKPKVALCETARKTLSTLIALG
jgi:hypothetical protein